MPAPQSNTWASPAPNTARRISHSRLGDNSRPMMNISITTPSSEIWATLAGWAISPSTLGPINTPPTR
ncbi:hypothetical protein D3C81_1546690 [compost metagenome]